MSPVVSTILGLIVWALLYRGVVFAVQWNGRREAAWEIAWAENAQERRFLREAQIEVDELIPMAPPIYDGWGFLAPHLRAERAANPWPDPPARFQDAVIARGMAREEFLASLVPPDAASAEVYPVPRKPAPTPAPGPGMKVSR